MTCIEFSKRNFFALFSTGLLLCVVVISAIINIWLYNAVASVRQDNAKFTTDIAHADVENAELKNKLYLLIEEQSHESFLESRGLVVEKNPHYTTMPSLVSRAN